MGSTTTTKYNIEVHQYLVSPPKRNMNCIASISIALVLLRSPLAIALSELGLLSQNIQNLNSVSILGKPSAAYSLGLVAIANNLDETKCVEELTKLTEDTNLAEAADFGSCPIEYEKTSSTSLEVSSDYSTCPAYGKFQLACTAAGGTPGVPLTIEFNCDVSKSGVDVKADVSLKNNPICLGPSCKGILADATQVSKDISELKVQGMESVFHNGGYSGTCSPASVTGDAAAGNARDDAATRKAGDDAAAGFGLHSPGLVGGLSSLFCLFAQILVCML